MPRLQAKSFTTPDETHDVPLAHIETVDLDDAHVGRCRFEPGWRWSEVFAPIVGLPSCPIRHLGYAISGNLRVVMDDGTALDIKPGDVFEIPPGHDKWVVGDEPWDTLEWGGSGRAWGEALREGRDRSLATVLFTDIVESTARLRQMGDRAWRHHLSDHNVRMREQINLYRGREISTTGDGFLVLFDSPTRAVRCAIGMVRDAAALATPIRAAVHTGEIELAGDDVRGIAVHVAARLLALAASGEILLTQTTADLIDGAGIALEGAGTHELKGLSGRRDVLRVA